MKSPQRPKTYAFGRLLTLILFLLLLASMSLIAVVSSVFTRRSVRDLSDRIVQQALGRVELRIEALLRQAINQNEQGRRLLEGRQLAADDFKQLGGFFAHSLAGLGDLTYLGFGLETNGDYVFAERLGDGSIRVREYLVDDSRQRVIRDWRWQGAERELLKVAPWDGYDPRQRPFYQHAVAAGTNTWTETYQFWQGSERGAVPGVTFATPLFGPNHRLVGVLNSDFDLAALCRFLADLRLGMQGYAFVVERRADGTRRLIAHPDPTVLPTAALLDTNGVASLRDRKVAAFMRNVLADQPLLSRVLAGNSVTFTAGEEKFFGGARRLGQPGQPAWAIGIVIPMDDVMAGVYRNDRRAFWTGLACLVLTALVAVGISRRVAEPLRLLTREARAIGRLELQEDNVAISYVAELATLATSMSEMKSSLRSFQKFVPVEVVREIVTSATEARLGGKRATLTLLFSDVKDFTAMAERMSPEALVALVGEYLGEMSEMILGGGGTVDKFIGDGIMAFWGAPRANPEHARDACRGALECQRALARRREHWLEAGQPALHTRIGLHTGAVIVGNIGSEKRLNYTALGDCVNLTSRIEGLNKFYGTGILVSAACAEAAGDAIVTRPVDQVSVKGRSEGLVVHELLAMTGEAEAWTLEAASLTAEAFAAYLRSDFDGAREGYRALLVLRPNDPVAALMEKRCSEFMAQPRPTEWDTTFRFKEK